MSGMTAEALRYLKDAFDDLGHAQDLLHAIGAKESNLRAPMVKVAWQGSTREICVPWRDLIELLQINVDTAKHKVRERGGAL